MSREYQTAIGKLQSENKQLKTEIRQQAALERKRIKQIDNMAVEINKLRARIELKKQPELCKTCGGKGIIQTEKSGYNMALCIPCPDCQPKPTSDAVRNTGKLMEGRIRKGGIKPRPSSPKPNIKPVGQKPLSKNCVLVEKLIAVAMQARDLVKAVQQNEQKQTRLHPLLAVVSKQKPNELKKAFEALKGE